MVPVDDPLVLGFGGLRRGLFDAQKNDWAWPSPDAGFAAWLFKLCDSRHPRIDSLKFNDKLPDAESGQAPLLASIGYAIVGATPGVTGEALESWNAGLDQLSRRDLFPADRQSFIFRPVEVLGIALGVSSDDGAKKKHATWLKDALKRVMEEDKRSNFWARVLMGVAFSRLGGEAELKPPPDRAVCTIDEIGLFNLMAATNPELFGGTDKLGSLREAQTELLLRVSRDMQRPQDLAKGAAIYLAVNGACQDLIQSSAKENWQAGRREKDAVELIVQICRKFHAFAGALKNRQRKRDPFSIGDEYDVQDALHGLLKLHFEDVRPEEVTPSYAGSSSRVDFLLKREKVAVEAKMTREGLDQKKVREQLIQDKEQYRAHPDCQALVCFVYDPDKRCDNPTALEDDLSESGNGLATRVVVAPKD